jgi:hypothetical protein
VPSEPCNTCTQAQKTHGQYAMQRKAAIEAARDCDTAWMHTSALPFVARSIRQSARLPVLPSASPSVRPNMSICPTDTRKRGATCSPLHPSIQLSVCLSVCLHLQAAPQGAAGAAATARAAAPRRCRRPRHRASSAATATRSSLRRAAWPRSASARACLSAMRRPASAGQENPKPKTLRPASARACLSATRRPARAGQEIPKPKTLRRTLSSACVYHGDVDAPNPQPSTLAPKPRSVMRASGMAAGKRAGRAKYT